MEANIHRKQTRIIIIVITFSLTILVFLSFFSLSVLLSFSISFVRFFFLLCPYLAGTGVVFACTGLCSRYHYIRTEICGKKNMIRILNRAHMKLTIKNLQYGDFGNYRCISKNSLGETEGSIRVYGKRFNYSLACAQYLEMMIICSKTFSSNFRSVFFFCCIFFTFSSNFFFALFSYSSSSNFL